MKKIILTVAAVFAFGFTNAQEAEVKEAKAYGFSKGDMFIEGAIKFTTGDTQDDYFAITPKFGYLLSDKLAVGADLNFSSNKNNLNDNKTSAYGFGGFARYNFLALVDNRLNAYGELGLGFSSTKFDPTIGNSSTDNGFKANIDLGINYFITKRLAATFELANILSYNNASPENGDSTSDLTIEVNLFKNIFAQPYFGLLYKF